MLRFQTLLLRQSIFIMSFIVVCVQLW